MHHRHRCLLVCHYLHQSLPQRISLLHFFCYGCTKNGVLWRVSNLNRMTGVPELIRATLIGSFHLLGAHPWKRPLHFYFETFHFIPPQRPLLYRELSGLALSTLASLRKLAGPLGVFFFVANHGATTYRYVGLVRNGRYQCERTYGANLDGIGSQQAFNGSRRGGQSVRLEKDQSKQIQTPLIVS